MNWLGSVMVRSTSFAVAVPILRTTSEAATRAPARTCGTAPFCATESLAYIGVPPPPPQPPPPPPPLSLLPSSFLRMQNVPQSGLPSHSSPGSTMSLPQAGVGVESLHPVPQSGLQSHSSGGSTISLPHTAVSALAGTSPGVRTALTAMSTKAMNELTNICLYILICLLY